MKITKILVALSFLFAVSTANAGELTVTGSIEGTALGLVKDVKTTYHYSTCVFTKTQCGDLDLD